MFWSPKVRICDRKKTNTRKCVIPTFFHTKSWCTATRPNYNKHKRVASTSPQARPRKDVPTSKQTCSLNEHTTYNPLRRKRHLNYNTYSLRHLFLWGASERGKPPSVWWQRGGRLVIRDGDDDDGGGGDGDVSETTKKLQLVIERERDLWAREIVALRDRRLLAHNWKRTRERHCQGVGVATGVGAERQSCPLQVVRGTLVVKRSARTGRSTPSSTVRAPSSLRMA